jgi:hypothetical protein
MTLDWGRPGVLIRTPLLTVDDLGLGKTWRFDQNNAAQKVDVSAGALIVHSVKQIAKQLAGLFLLPRIRALIRRDFERIIVAEDLSDIALVRLNRVK